MTRGNREREGCRPSQEGGQAGERRHLLQEREVGEAEQPSKPAVETKNSKNSMA